MNSQLNSLTMRPALPLPKPRPSRQPRPVTDEPRRADLVANADGDLFVSAAVNGSTEGADSFRATAGILSLLDVRAPHSRHAR